MLKIMWWPIFNLSIYATSRVDSDWIVRLCYKCLLRAKDVLSSVRPSSVQIICSKKTTRHKDWTFVIVQQTKGQKQLPRNTVLESWLACQFVPDSLSCALIIETIVYSLFFNTLVCSILLDTRSANWNSHTILQFGIYHLKWGLLFLLWSDSSWFQSPFE